MRPGNKPDSKVPKKRPPATTPEARENQMIALAVDMAEEQILNRTASSQVLTHFLKLGSTTSRLEKENLQQDVDLKKAKTEAIRSQKRVEELYKDALRSMRVYSGNQRSDDHDE